ncbi:MATE family efflux transporter [Lachnoclostridium sp. Marseille-P6806]|uniref:MATE family efflux transporter n=1 Tax=Lachnoclostridium sp. Marseille-P6806 TaxID=2364793 RepID=UPI001F5F220E|nr:MATE family efflux transporter [Lachnoclostridium sp. Marseille-P6806]
MMQSVRAGETESEESRARLATVFQIAWPAVLESFFLSLAGMIDTLMVSSIGSDAVAAVGLTTQPKFLGLACFFAMNTAVAALVAHRRGEGNRQGANETLAAAMLLTAALAALITILFVSGASAIMRFCGSNADTHDGAVTYFRIIMGGTVLNVFGMVINAAQRGSGNTRVAMVSNVVSSLANIFGNWVLIGGHLGFPALGITGAALATVGGTVFSLMISVHSLFRKDSFLSFPFILANQCWRRFSVIRSILHLSVSTFAEQVLMRIGFMSTAIMAADMGTEALAAHQVGMNCLGLSFSFGDGLQQAAVSLIGQSLGEGSRTKAKRYGWLCEGIALCLAAMMFLVYGFGGRSIFGLFFEEASIVEMGVGISRIIMVTVLFQICQVVFTGCLRGAGDVVYTMLTSMISVTFIRTLVSYVCCYILGWGIYGIWIGILADQFCRLNMSGWHFKRGKWMEIRI